MKPFKIRCSAIGNIMSEPRAKKAREVGELSQTSKSYCETWLKEQLYQRRKEFTSKHTEKGNIMEDNSIDFMAEQMNLGFLLKNEEYFENDFMTGTPDIILPDLIIDVKNSWDCFTFPVFEKDIPNKNYWWQGQGYMELTGRKHFKLVYILSDTPEHLIAKEAYYYAKNNGYEEVSTEMYNEFMDKMTYSDIPDKLKIKVFKFDYDPDAILKVKSQVEKCQTYIEQLKSNFKIKKYLK